MILNKSNPTGSTSGEGSEINLIWLPPQNNLGRLINGRFVIYFTKTDFSFNSWYLILPVISTIFIWSRRVILFSMNWIIGHYDIKHIRMISIKNNEGRSEGLYIHYHCNHISSCPTHCDISDATLDIQRWSYSIYTYIYAELSINLL